MHSPDIQSTSLQYALRRRLLHMINLGNLAPNQAAGLEVLAALCRPLYIPIVKEQNPNQLDRTSSFFFGFPWTSGEFPWPDRCAEPCFGESLLHAPLVQLNLDQISKSIGEYVGSGLFQVFLPDDYEACYGRDGNGVDACIRSIPSSTVARTMDMTPFPLEGKSALDACKFWNLDGVPDSYNDLRDDPIYTWDRNRWTVERLETTLNDLGFPSDGYEMGPAIAIVDWVPHIPLAQIEVSRLSDRALRSLFADWDLNADYEPEGAWINREIIEELFGAEFDQLFPRPALFGWPKANNARAYAIHTRQMPLIVFDGIYEDEGGDWLDVFEDIAFWCHGYYL